jgi:hypothetical protein
MGRSRLSTNYLRHEEQEQGEKEVKKVSRTSRRERWKAVARKGSGRGPKLYEGARSDRPKCARPVIGGNPRSDAEAKQVGVPSSRRVRDDP